MIYIYYVYVLSMLQFQNTRVLQDFQQCQEFYRKSQASNCGEQLPCVNSGLRKLNIGNSYSDTIPQSAPPILGEQPSMFKYFSILK